MAHKLEDGRYLLDEQEQLTLAHAARMIGRAEDRRVDLTLPLSEFDYLLLLAAALLALGDDAVEVIERAVRECLEERRRHRH